MAGLFDIDLGVDAVVWRGGSGFVRRIRHDGASGVISSDEEVGIILNLSSSHRVDCRVGTASSSAAPAIGTISILPPRQAIAVTIVGSCAALALRLPWSAVASAAGMLQASPDQVAIPLSLHARDPALAHLVYRAAFEDADGQRRCLAGIADHLVATWSCAAKSAPLRPRLGGIPPLRLRSVLQRIQDDLHGPLRVAALASEARMSVFHFTRAFERATGLSPHRYVVHRRVDRAIQLLGQASTSITDVAHAAGFAQASHLARAMREVTGTTPNIFRKHVLP